MKPGLILAAVLVICTTSVLPGQTRKPEAKWFTVKGTVVDNQGHPVPAGMVSLKDTQSKTLSMKRTDGNGHFTFSWVDAHCDYEIYAEQEGAVSEKVLISAPHKDEDIVLKLKPSRK